MNYENPELRRRLADEYVLGTLRGAARRRFERLLTGSAELRREVEALSRHWDTLAEILPPTEPSITLWPDIERRIAPELGEREAGWLWVNFKFWRANTLLASLVAGALALYLLLAPPQPVYVVVITDDARSQPGWVLSGGAGSADQLKVKNITAQPLPPGRDFQLWVKLQDQPQVRPVGLLPATGEALLALPPGLLDGRFDRIEKFGVSIEPAGGSPTGQPTTTPLYHGQSLTF